MPPKRRRFRWPDLGLMTLFMVDELPLDDFHKLSGLLFRCVELPVIANRLHSVFREQVQFLCVIPFQVL